ncbi:MAG: hypothetical protein QOK81_04405, partial [Nitrososphaeraceae archaeon]|nr:hypothetical protein [Nitrososphaeraceae archaeon]
GVRSRSKRNHETPGKNQSDTHTHTRRALLLRRLRVHKTLPLVYVVGQESERNTQTMGVVFEFPSPFLRLGTAKQVINS